MDKKYELTEEQKTFVDNNRQLTPREISERLKVPIEAVNRYKNHISWNHMVFYLDLFIRHFISKLEKHKKKIVIGLFAFIMLFAWDIRHYTYFLPHLRGDQSHYTALAMKLETKGLDGYTLRGVDEYASKESQYLLSLFPSAGKGSLLESLAAANITYYDEPFHHMPFGFPVALMISHSIFARGEPYHILHVPNEYEIIRNNPPGVGLKDFRFPPKIGGKQFYAVIVPLFFSLVFIAVIYFLGMEIYNNEFISLAAMFLVAISPTAIMTAQKVWADDMTAAFAAAGALLYIKSVRKDSFLMALAGGICCGIAIITKQLGVFVPVAIFTWHFVSNIDRLFKKESALSVLFDKKLIAFSAGTALISAFWFLKVYSYYGNPLYRPGQKDLAVLSKDIWFKMLAGRPRYLYAVSIPYQTPLFFLAYLSPLTIWFKPENWRKFSLPVIWLIMAAVLSHFLYITGEERYWLPNFAAFALLASYTSWEIKEYLDTKFKMFPGTWLFIVSLLLCAAWSVPMGLEAVFRNEALIMKPF